MSTNEKYSHSKTTVVVCDNRFKDNSFTRTVCCVLFPDCYNNKEEIELTELTRIVLRDDFNKFFFPKQ